jgi:hypothetical protein
VLVVAYQTLAIARLEQGAAATVPRIERARVPAVQIAHPAGDMAAFARQHQVVVGGHQTDRVTRHAQRRCALVSSATNAERSESSTKIGRSSTPCAVPVPPRGSKR